MDAPASTPPSVRDNSRRMIATAATSAAATLSYCPKALYTA
jgi:hypothetical protein